VRFQRVARSPAKIRRLGHRDRLHRLADRLALRRQDIHLPQLGDSNLVLRPTIRTDHFKGRIPLIGLRNAFLCPTLRLCSASAHFYCEIQWKSPSVSVGRMPAHTRRWVESSIDHDCPGELGPRISRIAYHALTKAERPSRFGRYVFSRLFILVVPQEGFEPPTPSLRMSRLSFSGVSPRFLLFQKYIENKDLHLTVIPGVTLCFRYGGDTVATKHASNQDYQAKH